MDAEKVNGTRPDFSWLEFFEMQEQREMAQLMASGILNEVMPKLKEGLNKQFGTMMIFGTSGEIHSSSYEELWNNPEGYNLKQ